MEKSRAFTVDTGTVIDDVTIVNTHDGSVEPGMAVYVEDGRIDKVVQAGSILCAGTARLINASGKYVVPGFLDMHAHALFSDAFPPSIVSRTSS